MQRNWVLLLPFFPLPSRPFEMGLIGGEEYLSVTLPVSWHRFDMSCISHVTPAAASRGAVLGYWTAGLSLCITRQLMRGASSASCAGFWLILIDNGFPSSECTLLYLFLVIQLNSDSPTRLLSPHVICLRSKLPWWLPKHASLALMHVRRDLTLPCQDLWMTAMLLWCT